MFVSLATVTARRAATPLMFSSTNSHRNRKNYEWFVIHSLVYRVFDLGRCGMQKGALCPIMKTENFAKHGCKKLLKIC